MTVMAEKTGVVGLGYVGLPLALALSAHGEVVGVDTDGTRLEELRRGEDRTGEVAATRLAAATSLTFAATMAAAADCRVYIVTAPTPVFADYRPNLSLLEAATTAVGEVLKKGDMVVFESTVCPGTTDDFCVPLLQRRSALRVNDDFDCAYSPERISPNEKGLSDAVKIISASNPAAVARVRRLYQNIVPAGLYEAPSIKTAEAAKLAENIQRDADIAVVNELAMIYGQMGIDSAAVFDAAATKWNYRRFYPGLVGGHCIGTDSYYLLDRATADGMAAPVLRAARQANNAVPIHIGDNVLRLLRERDKDGSRNGGNGGKAPSVLLLGFSFKQGCADVRNTLVEPLRQHLLAADCAVRVCDPVADAARAQGDYGVCLERDVAAALADKPDAVVFAVAHPCFADISEEALSGVLVADVKRIAPRADWRL